MNTLVRSDLRYAWNIAQGLLKDDMDGCNAPMENRIGRLAEAVDKLCHVCAALNEEQRKQSNPEEKLADLQLRIYKLEKALKCHTNTQDAHNF